MQMVHTLGDIPRDGRFVFALGFFDGFHRGHRQIWEAARAMAGERGALPGLMTFSPHPASVLFPDRPVPLLQSEAERVRYMEEMGAAIAVVLRPTRAFLAEPAETFLEELSAVPGLSGLLCGENFTFGRGAEGSAGDLARYFRTGGVRVQVLPLMTDASIGGRVISSSEIRRFLAEGDAEKAAALLGRPYELSGDIVHGFKRGASALGFPTANLSLGEGRILPADGVYASYARIRGKRYPAVTNVGKNPTFGNTKRTVETFILDFDECIYGEPFSIELISRIRGEIRFQDVSLLCAQIEKDIGRAKEILTR